MSVWIVTDCEDAAAEVHQYIFSHRVEEYAKQSMSAIFIPPNGAADFGVL